MQAALREIELLKSALASAKAKEKDIMEKLANESSARADMKLALKSKEMQVESLLKQIEEQKQARHDREIQLQNQLETLHTARTRLSDYNKYRMANPPGSAGNAGGNTQSPGSSSNASSNSLSWNTVSITTPPKNTDDTTTHAPTTRDTSISIASSPYLSTGPPNLSAVSSYLTKNKPKWKPV